MYNGEIVNSSFSVIISVFYCCILYLLICPVQAPGCKNRPAPFPGWMSYKVTNTKPGLVCVLYLSMLLIVLLGPFCVLLIFVGMCSVFSLF